MFEHEQAMAEWTVMAMLALIRDLVVLDRDLRRGEWHLPPSGSRAGPGVRPRDLRGRTVGVIGLGHIGGRVAELGRALRMRAIAVTRSPSRGGRARSGSTGSAAGTSCRACCGSPTSRSSACRSRRRRPGWSARASSSSSGRRRISFNVARGPVVDEAALYAALRDRAITGAALDVWYRYPARGGEVMLPASLPFWELDNVVMTPNTSGQSESMVRGRWEFLAGQLERFAAGEPLENVLAVGPG